MNTQFYSPKDEFEAAKAVVTDSLSLTNGAKATQILPSATRFAIVIRAIERDENESFGEVSVGITGVSLGTNQSIVNMFVGYFAIVEQNLVIYKDDGSLVIQAPLNAVSVDMSSIQKNFILHAAGKKFRLENPLGINNVTFESRAVGFNDGLNPFFDALAAGGAVIKAPSNKKNVIQYSIAAGIFLLLAIIIGVMSIIK